MVAWRKITSLFSERRTALLLFFAYLLHKIAFFFFYSLQYSDHDQATVWLMASDFASGYFPSLFFYGQNYNVALDAILAIPLVFIGIEPHLAVPLTLLLLSILPVWLLWKHCFNNQQYLTACLITMVFLLAPFTLNYLFSTGIGLSVCIALTGAFALQQTHNKWAIFFTCLLVSFSAFSVANALPVLIWMLVCFSFSNGLYARIMASLGVILGFGIYKLFAAFSSTALVVHQQFELKNSVEIFLKNIQSLPELFYGMGPFLDYAGIFYLIICVFFTVFFIYKKQYNIGFANAIACIFIVTLFSTDKISDHQQNAYFTGARYFISLIAIAVMNVYFLRIQLNIKYIFTFLFAIVFINIVVFYMELDKTIKIHIEKNKSTGVMSTSLLKKQYKIAEKALNGLDDKTIISMDHPTLMYAMQAWNKKCKTLFLPYERRRKEYLEFYNSEINTAYLLDVRVPAGTSGSKEMAHVPGYLTEQIRCDELLLYKITGKGLTGAAFMEKSGWEWWQRL